MPFLSPRVGRSARSCSTFPGATSFNTVAASLLAVGLFSAQPLAAQGTQPPTSATAAQPPASPARMSLDELKRLAETHLAIGAVHDSADAKAAKAKNKTEGAQKEVAAEKQKLVADVLKQKGLTDAEYRRQRYLVSTSDALRQQFDSVVAKLTGAPLPGRAVAATVQGFVPASQLPSGMVGTHISHLTTSYVDTPDKSGLLVMAFAEAAVATQHALLATRTPNDLAAMQLHAGHVIHAMDPTLVTSGPGKGFGLKKAASGAANHIELAAKEPNASPNVKVHATHIATAARAAEKRADAVIALARQIQGAKDAKSAAALTSQLASLCGQLAMGFDANADGRIDWSDGEGGLQQAFEHIQLMLAGERR